MSKIDSIELFPELASTLLYFTEKLVDSLVKDSCADVFFLSREGQPLKKIFDLYANKRGLSIRSHYLEVSRRSTLLPSLKNLEDECFDTLFRQYRKISLLEFLSSLGLEDRSGYFVNLLKFPHGADSKREIDFPSSEIFQALISSPEFIDLYEMERLKRRLAFINYLTIKSGGILPEKLVVVDVGWKGTIQDNLHAMLCSGDSAPVKSVLGYYIGLVAEGASSTTNVKHGLLFTSVPKRSPKFYIFNENRALFEVVLAADHGSVASYEINTNGYGAPVYGSFEEREMVFSKIMPVQNNIIRKISRLTESMHSTDYRIISSFQMVACEHSRMVFDATSEECEWLSSIFHVENYGVFERSFFSSGKKDTGILTRIIFLFNLLSKKKRGVLGFWPWQTIENNLGRFAARFYGFIRTQQR